MIQRTPQQQRLQQTIQRGRANAASIVPPGATRSNERPLNYQFTALKVLSCSARQIQPCDVSVGGGNTAWFCFAQWTVGETLAPGFFNGYRFELGGTNPAGEGDEDFVGVVNEDFSPWGNGDGFGGAIAITVNSQFAELGKWREGPGYVPFVNEGSVAINYNQSSEGENFFLHFAAGKQSDRPRPFVARVSQTTPLAIVLSPGDRLAVSFVGRKAQTAFSSLYGILLRVYGELYISSLLASRSIMQ